MKIRNFDLTVNSIEDINVQEGHKVFKAISFINNESISLGDAKLYFFYETNFKEMTFDRPQEVVVKTFHYKDAKNIVHRYISKQESTITFDVGESEFVFEATKINDINTNIEIEKLLT